MSRCSWQPTVVVGSESPKGLLRTGENVAYTRAVAALHRLVVHERGDHLELALV